ncbi:MAG: hypothetical protein KAG53_09100 [Endozoicomonadaceae bacterium]|nr:hypothetical protein [Endozoicomonadaceae bacterium]
MNTSSMNSLSSINHSTSMPTDEKPYFSQWKAMSYDDKINNIQENIKNNYGDAIKFCKNINDRKVNFISTNSGNEVSSKNIWDLWNDINLFRDAHYALKLQLEEMNYTFDEHNALIEICNHFDDKLKTIDRHIEHKTTEIRKISLDEDQFQITLACELLKSLKDTELLIDTNRAGRIEGKSFFLEINDKEKYYDAEDHQSTECKQKLDEVDSV